MVIITDSHIFSMDPEIEDHPARIKEPIPRPLAVAVGGGIAVFASREQLTLLGKETRAYPLTIPEPVTCLLVIDNSPVTILMGTEKARLYRWTENQLAPIRVPTFDSLDCRRQWHTPWGGPPAVRSLAGSPDGWVYADIHVGSVMRSPDNGDHWEPVTPDLNEDVHQVATCHAAPDRVYANTAKGIYVSGDRGDTWVHRAGDLGNRYGRAVAICPNKPDCMIASVSDGPHGDNFHGELHVTRNGGTSWEHVKKGFPESTTQNINTFHLSFSRNGMAWAAYDRILYRGKGPATEWECFWTAPEPIKMLSQPFVPNETP